MNQTSQNILNASIQLFSKKGYHDTSVREICESVGIKESSLYYHFDNKESLYISLQHEFVERTQILLQFINLSLLETESLPIINEEDFVHFGTQFVDKCFCDSFFIQYIRFMSIQQSTDMKLSQLYQEWCYDIPVTICEEYFSILMKKKVLKKQDAQTLAIQFYTPIHYHFQKVILSLLDKKTDFINSLESHFHVFFNQNKTETL